MSAILAALSRVTAALGGAPAAGGIIVIGLVVGGIVGGAAGGAFIPAATPTPSPLAVYPCPDTGPPLANLPAGQHLLVTGRTADGTWLRVHHPGAVRPEAWVQASAIKLEGPVTDLPVGECPPEVMAALLAAPSAGPTLTVVGSFVPTPPPTPKPTPTPTPRPTPKPTPRPTAKPTPRPTPRPTPTPTAPPDKTAPVVGTPSAKPNPVVPPPCGQGTTTVSVTAYDLESGIKSVTLHWIDVQGVPKSKPMALSSGRVWSVVLSNQDIPYSATYNPYAVAVNKAGLSAQGGRGSFLVDFCIT